MEKQNKSGENFVVASSQFDDFSLLFPLIERKKEDKVRETMREDKTKQLHFQGDFLLILIHALATSLIKIKDYNIIRIYVPEMHFNPFYVEVLVEAKTI